MDMMDVIGLYSLFGWFARNRYFQLIKWVKV